MRCFWLLGLMALLSAEVVVADSEPAEGYRLVWSDEFETDGRIDRDKWHVVEGNGCPELCGFGNDELQSYTAKKRNLRVKDGKLLITALKRGGYTSAKITTERRAAWQYARVEMRAKLPAGIGTWPAFWMLPEEARFGGWPKSGEIDIMEHVGFRPGYVHGTIHTEAYNHGIGTHKGQDIHVPDAAEAFHVYAMEWDADSLKWYVDGKLYYQIDKEAGDGSAEWPFDQPFHLILNLAIGGGWGGQQGIDRAAFPATYEIDWVRVWQKPE